MNLALNLELDTTKPEQFSTIEEAFRTSAKTSIARKVPSAPLKHLLKLNLIPSEGSCLNFGKGRDDIDSDAIASIAGNCTNYDYTYCRTDIFGSNFNFVYCGYVQNTLPQEAREVTWKQLASVTNRENGTCYVAVRTDKDVAKITGEAYQDGLITNRQTFQVGYSEEKLLSEASKHFPFCTIIKVSGFRLIRCSHAKVC